MVKFYVPDNLKIAKSCFFSGAIPFFVGLMLIISPYRSVSYDDSHLVIKGFVSKREIAFDDIQYIRHWETTITTTRYGRRRHDHWRISFVETNAAGSITREMSLPLVWKVFAAERMCEKIKEKNPNFSYDLNWK